MFEKFIDRVPYGIFTKKEIYNLEQERIFRGPTWNYVGLEAEIPSPGDYKTTFVGDTPVVITRGEEHSVHGWVNRCAHRGALVCRALKGNAQTHTCVYHQWSFDAKGDLVGVPFRRGIAGIGGYPKDFKLEDHPLQKLNIDVFNGVIFASFAHDMPSIASYLGLEISHFLKRIFHKPIDVIGYARQYLRGNWKFYAENTRDPYHASLLHLFFTRFDLHHPGLLGGQTISSDGLHNVNWSCSGKKQFNYDKDEVKMRADQLKTFTLDDPSLLDTVMEFEDQIDTAILSIFPNCVVQQNQNTLATRQIVTDGAGGMELIWTFFGYQDDSPPMRTRRLKQLNLVGPAGYISMEDGESTELCQKAIENYCSGYSVLQLNGRDFTSTDHLVSESGVRGFWHAYQTFMNFKCNDQS